MTDLVISSPTSSSDPPEYFEDNSVVLSTQPLHVWAWKTLESASSKIDIPSDTHMIRSKFSLMTKVLATDDLISYVQIKYKLEWEQAMVLLNITL